MRVLYFYQYFTGPQGSWSTRVYAFARHWVKAGDEVRVITCVYDKSGLKPEGFVSRHDVDGIDVRVLNIRLSNKHGFVFRLCTFAAYACLASWYALTLPADIVISSSGPLSVGLPGLVARYLRRIPFVFEVRDLWPEGAIQLGILRNGLAIKLARWFEKSCYTAAAQVVALSEGMADWIHQTYAIEKITVIPNLSDNRLADSSADGFHLPDWANGKPLAVYAGTLGLIDDCAQILRVARVFHEQGNTDVEFVLIGDGKERRLLEGSAQEMRLNHVHFLGLLPKPDVMRWLRVSCCSLFTVKDVPFLATASPNKIFDAFAVGLPIVQASQGWIKRLLERRDCGITVPPNDTQAMADAVLRIVRDPELRDRLSRNAKRAAMEEFDQDLLAARMREVLQNSLAAR